MVKIKKRETVYEGSLGEFGLLLELAKEFLTEKDGCLSHETGSFTLHEQIKTYAQFENGMAHFMSGSRVVKLRVPSVKGAFLLNLASALDTLAAVKSLKTLGDETRVTMEKVILQEPPLHRQSFILKIGNFYDFYYETQSIEDGAFSKLLSPLLP